MLKERKNLIAEWTIIGELKGSVMSSAENEASRPIDQDTFIDESVKCGRMLRAI